MAVLVNSAGVYCFSPLFELTDSELRRQFDINVFGLLFAREVLKHFPQDGGECRQYRDGWDALERTQFEHLHGHKRGL